MHSVDFINGNAHDRDTLKRMKRIQRFLLLFAAGGGLAVAFSTSAFAQARWVAYEDALGTRVEYPEHIFSQRQGQEGGGPVYVSRDRRARLHIFSMKNPQAMSPREFMRSNFPAPRSSLTYDRVAQNFFAISTRKEGLIVYLRCNFSGSRGGTLHCVDIRYPVSEKKNWDGIVTRISWSLKPLPRS